MHKQARAEQVQSRRKYSRVATVCLLVMSLCAKLIADGEAAAAQEVRKFAGLSVGDVLDNLRSQGLTFIYNTRLVPSDMRVIVEPTAQRGFALAEEILTAHGLGISRVTAGVFAVVAGKEQAPKSRPSPAPQQAGEEALEQVIVQTSRYALHSDFTVEQSLITHEDVQGLPSFGEEPLRAVQRLPGIASNGFSSIGAVRGGEPNETAIVLDGLRLYEPFHLKNFFSPVSLLDSRLVQNMQVSAGGFLVTQGDRSSAIIEATTLNPNAPRYYEAGLSLFHANVLASTQFADERGQGVLSIRRSNIGDLAQFSERDFGKPEYLDGFGKLDYRLSDATRLSVHALASNDRVVALRNSGAERAEAEYRNTYLWGTVEHDWSDVAHSRLVVSYTDVNNERDGRLDEPGKRSGIVRDYRNFHIVGLRVDHELDAWGIDHQLGLEIRRLWGGYDYRSDVRFEAGFPFPDSDAVAMHRAVSPKPDSFESGAWWNARIALDDRWTMQAGLRVDTQTYDGSGDDEQIAPRLNVLYAPSETTRLRATWGRFFQSHAINELQVEDGVDRFYGAQHADHWIVGLDQQLSEALDIRVEAYRKHYRDLKPRFENLFNPLVLLPETQFDRVMIEPTRARVDGLEVFLRWESPGPWRAWLGYSWSKARDWIDGSKVLRSWDQTHAVNAGVGWASGSWSVMVADSFHTGWPITKLRAIEDEAGLLQPAFSERNSSRLHNFNSLDVRVARTFALPRGALDVFFEATNLLSRDNECCIEYDVKRVDGKLILVEDVHHWLPLVPSLGVLWRY